MDPEMIRLAQEQMSRIPPSELIKMQQQMFQNPELMRMATEGMKNMRPEDLRFAAEQMRHIPPEQIADLSSRMANVTPEQIAAMNAQKDYQVQGALFLKNQGNELHGAGKYLEAIEKYLKAKENLMGVIGSASSDLRVTCSLNLMSCYLKTSEYDKAIQEGSEVLGVDPNNLKALYRRGQAYKAKDQLDLAVADLSKAAAVAPDDETVDDVLRQVKDKLDEQGCSVQLNHNGPVIEEITDEEAEHLEAQSTREQDISTQENVMREASTSDLPDTSSKLYADALNSVNQNPELLRNMQSMMANVDPEQMAAISGGKLTPEMAQLTIDMMKHMSPADLENMVKMASTMGSLHGASNSGTEGVPDVATSTPPASILPRPSTTSTQNLRPVFSNDQLRTQMNNPAMREMMTSMLKNMSPETMSSMSQQFGVHLTPEQAVEAQRTMASMTPDQIDKLMRWAERAQMVVEQIKRAKAWILGYQGLVIAIVMLLIAVVLHYFGFIGK